MPDIRDHAILREASAKLEDLLASCRPGGALHVRAPNIATDVTRKAKALRTSLAGLIAALESGAEPEPEQPKRQKASLRSRLFRYPLLCDMVRFVGHSGRSEIEFWDHYRDLAARYSQPRASAAYEELCELDRSTTPATILLKPAVRAMAGQLLGEAPGEGR